MKVDETSMAIIKHLREGRKSFKRIANQLSLSENTVRTRVARLIEEGVLEISGCVNPEAIPGHTLGMVGVSWWLLAFMIFNFFFHELSYHGIFKKINGDD